MISPADPAQQPPKARLYGRRKGRKLRNNRRGLMETLLPTLRFELPAAGVLDPRTLFPAAIDDIWLEIGFGAGEHLAHHARSEPRIGMIGAEVFENGVSSLLVEIARDNLSNVRIFMDDARLLLDQLPDRSLGRCFILFPDPWPKERHKKRRIVSTEVLDALARAMKPAAELRIATDHGEYAEWMEERVAVHPGFTVADRGVADWPGRPADWPPTRYEEKLLAGGPPRFFRLIRKAE